MNKPVYLSVAILKLSKIVTLVLVGLCETEILRKIKTILYGNRQLFSIHKNRRHLGRHCKRC